MSNSQPGPKSPAVLSASTGSGEAKARGANRSTKVAGKLKVLPEHAEPVLEDKTPAPPAPPRDKDEAGEGSGTLADSEDEEPEEEDEPEDAEVRHIISATLPHTLAAIAVPHAPLPASHDQSWCPLGSWLLTDRARPRIHTHAAFDRCTTRSTSSPPAPRGATRSGSQRRRPSPFRG